MYALLANNTRSPASPTPQTHSRSPSTRSPALLSRNSTSTVLLKDKSRPKDRDHREAEAEDAGEAASHTTAIAGTTGNGTAGSSTDVARSPAAAPVLPPNSSSAIDPLSQVSIAWGGPVSGLGSSGRSRAHKKMDGLANTLMRCAANLYAKEHRTVDPAATDPDGRRLCPRELGTLEKCDAGERHHSGEEVGGTVFDCLLETLGTAG